MSGRARKTIYFCITTSCLLAAIVACALMFFSAYRAGGTFLHTLFSFLIFFGVTVLTSPCVIVHECGHLLFGLCARLKPVSVCLGRVAFENKRVRVVASAAAGKTEFVPRGGEGVRRRMMIAAIGGATFNFLFGILFFVLFFLLPVNPILLFFELFAPLHLFEGIAALLPAELSTGRTDGELFRLLKNNAPEARVLVSAMTAQGILFSETFDGIDEKLLFAVPVVREDDPAFLSLLHLRWQYLMWKNETLRAGKELFRLEELSDCLGARESAQILCDATFMRRIAGEVSDSDSALPTEAKGTCSYLRAELALGRGSKEEYQKRAAAEVAAGIRALESVFFERFIQNF